MYAVEFELPHVGSSRFQQRHLHCILYRAHLDARSRSLRNNHTTVRVFIWPILEISDVCGGVRNSFLSIQFRLIYLHTTLVQRTHSFSSSLLCPQSFMERLHRVLSSSALASGLRYRKNLRCFPDGGVHLQYSY